MSSSQAGVDASAEKFRNITDDAVGQARDLATQTAQQLDSGQYGLDAWFRSMAQFVDIVAKGSAAHFTTAIAGPCLNAGSNELPASEEEVVLTTMREYPRKISIHKPFKDVVRPDVVIPNHAVTIAPAVIPAKAAQFTLRVNLTDTHYVGRNYAAVLALTATADTSGTGEVDYQVVTVAL